MRFRQQKISNHQGLFAFIATKFPNLTKEWEFFEEIRTIRNRNKYLGADITKDMWQRSQAGIDLAVMVLETEIKRYLESMWKAPTPRAPP